MQSELFSGARQYRDLLASELVSLRNKNKKGARTRLAQTKKDMHYQLARGVHRDSKLLQTLPNGGATYTPEPNGSERVSFGFYTSNEYYKNLAPLLKNQGGVGIARGFRSGA